MNTQTVSLKSNHEVIGANALQCASVIRQLSYQVYCVAPEAKNRDKFRYSKKRDQFDAIAARPLQCIPDSGVLAAKAHAVQFDPYLQTDCDRTKTSWIGCRLRCGYSGLQRVSRGHDASPSGARATCKSINQSDWTYCMSLQTAYNKDRFKRAE